MAGAPLAVVAEVTEPRPVHRVPHRTNRVFSGLVSLRGQLHLCVSMHGLLEVDPPDPSEEPPASPRLVVIRQGPDRWTFPAEEVVGVQAVPMDRLEKRPLDARQPGRQLQPGGLRLGLGAERRRDGRTPDFPGPPEDGRMSDDLSGFSLMDLFRSEAEGQTALLSEGLWPWSKAGSPRRRAWNR